MELSDIGSDRGRLVSAVLSVVLIAIAISSLRKGKRLSGAVAVVSAVVLGYNAAGRPRDLTEPLDIGGTSEEGELRCAVCGEPIVSGQLRSPNADGEIVHEDCKRRPARGNRDGSIFSRVRKDVMGLV